MITWIDWKFDIPITYTNTLKSILKTHSSTTKLILILPRHSFQQECIPVRCVMSTAVAISHATHAPCHPCPLPCMPIATQAPTPCHAYPLLYMPPTMYTPCHTCPLPHTPPAMHTPCHACPLPCTPACHACPLPCTPACHACPHHAHLSAMHATEFLTRACENITFLQLLLRTVLIPNNEYLELWENYPFNVTSKLSNKEL